MTFKITEYTPEELENQELRKLYEKQKDKLENYTRDIYHKAWDFYSAWIREDEKLSKSEAQNYFQKALMAAEVFVDGMNELKLGELE